MNVNIINIFHNVPAEDPESGFLLRSVLIIGFLP